MAAKRKTPAPPTSRAPAPRGWIEVRGVSRSTYAAPGQTGHVHPDDQQAAHYLRTGVLARTGDDTDDTGATSPDVGAGEGEVVESYGDPTTPDGPDPDQE